MAEQKPPARPHFNGVDSTRSSRDASPSTMTRINQIPASQLPPGLLGRLNAPRPGPPLDALAQKTAQLNVSSNHGTSTPNELTIDHKLPSELSPIVRPETTTQTTPLKIESRTEPKSLFTQNGPGQRPFNTDLFTTQPTRNNAPHPGFNRPNNQPPQAAPIFKPTPNVVPIPQVPTVNQSMFVAQNQFQAPPVSLNQNAQHLNEPRKYQLNPTPMHQPPINPPAFNLKPNGPPAPPPVTYSQPITQTSPVNAFLPPTQCNRAPPPSVPSYSQNSVPPQYTQPPTITPSMQNKANLHGNRYPTSTFQQNPPYGGVTAAGFSKMWGHEHIDLLQNPNVLPPTKVEPPRVQLGQDILDHANCTPDIFRCTLTKIPESSALLQKSRLPLGILIHPFKDLTNLPVIQCNVIVRCRACRTYINPFVYFVDNRRWKCNLCYRVNDLPEEFQYDPVSKSYGDPSRRPEIKASTIEYIAPAEYMLRPPQPAVYLFLLDVSRLAIESGYLHTVCTILVEELKNLPGDARTQIGFIAYDSTLHFYALIDGVSQPHEMTVLEVDDIFLPCPDNLLVNLKECTDLVVDLLTQLPTKYNNTFDSNSALGPALQAAYKLMAPTGGRVTVFQCALPNVGPGALQPREDPSQRAASEIQHLNPATDFYKRLALDCNGQQIAVDLFVLNSQYVDLASISGISRFSGGCIHHIPLFKVSRTLQSERFERMLRRYLTRKIGFEAVMRLRCTRGLSIHTFHGNFFVRSTDLLALPNVNPDAGFGMQISIDENLSDCQTVCFQAAVLYTSSKGERRIRVHTLCLPIVANLQDVIHGADQQCVAGLVAKMAVDRSLQSSVADARDAFINVAIDILAGYKLAVNVGDGMSSLLAPDSLRLVPLYISALLKSPAFRTGKPTRLDDRVKAMIDMKTKPLAHLMQSVYPDLYPVHDLELRPLMMNGDEQVHLPPRIQLTARCLDAKGAFLMDIGEHMILLVNAGVSPTFLNQVLGVSDYTAIGDEWYELPVLENVHNQRLHQFIDYLNDDRPFAATLQIIRDNSPNRVEFYERLIEDRVENALSYHEFLQHLKTQVK